MIREFERQHGMELRGAYITAALRCAPPANKPLKEELATCQPFLLRELEMLAGVEVVVALGKIGFDAYLRTLAPRGIEPPRPRPRFGHTAEYVMEDGTVLIGSYHPSQQNTQTGRLTQDMFDAVFRRARQIVSCPLA